MSENIEPETPTWTGILSQEDKNKWITALRSGAYVQGRGSLRHVHVEENPNAFDENEDYVDGEPKFIPDFTKQNFCCLGVLADITNVGWMENRLADGYSVVATSFVEDGFLDEAILPQDVQEILANKNDVGTDFLDIADWIESHL